MTSTIANYGVCRCCLASGNHSDIMTEYFHKNGRTVYNNIFIECFNLFLSSHKALSTLICSICISKLLEASTFRDMVVRTERQLLESLTDLQDAEMAFIDVSIEQTDSNTDVKTEVNDEYSDGTGRYHFETDLQHSCDSNYDDSESLIDGEETLLSRFSWLRPLPTREQLRSICPSYVKHLKRLQGKTITPTTIQNQLDRKTKERFNLTDKLALATNACALLENSNATVFKTKMRSGFPCFYCRQIFLNLESLQRHQTSHSKTELFKLLKKYTADELVVYADITDLKCNLCQDNIASIDKLKIHLKNNHEIKFYPDYTDRVIPFKLKEKDFECQICGFTFETFGATEKHMNTHYRNYVCEKCGSGFVTNHRLKTHMYLVHRQKNFDCDICKKSFQSQIKFKIHYDVVHKLVKNYKCSQCPERFIDYFSRQKHLVKIHKVEPILYTCKVCDRSFNRRYTLSLHIKRCHLEEKHFKCDLCNYTCFNRTELKEHMLKHSGERCFQCSLCNKKFGRRKTLQCHMRIHGKDRFGCGVCGQQFVYKSSLKGHLKTQHGQFKDN